jgi:Protein of unknown function (DUF1044).
MEMIPIVTVETASFIRSSSFWGEEDIDDFKNYIASNYEAGDIIPGTGGIRKIRWSRPGIGKRGGARVIYYYYDRQNPIYLLFAYPKNVKDNLTEEEKKALHQIADQLKNQLRRNTHEKR